MTKLEGRKAGCAGSDSFPICYCRFLRPSSFGFRHSLDVSTSLDMTDECLMGQQRASCSSYAIKFVFASCHF